MTKPPAMPEPIKTAVSKLKSAQMCHPNAVQHLIEEALAALQSAQPADHLIGVIAQYVADHCVDGESHASVIRGMAGRCGQQHPAEVSDDDILTAGHRLAWRYKHSTDPSHSSTYTFNRACLLQFARAILALRPAQQATPASAPQSLLMRLAGIAAECSDPDTTDALDALIAATQQATPEPVGEVVATVRTIRGVTIGYLETMLPDGTPLYTRPAPGVPDGWQPIQTAPTDGTKFLGWRRGQVATSYRVPRDDCEMWCFGGTSGAFEHWPETRPEFWMPHPPEPALAAAQAKGADHDH